MPTTITTPAGTTNPLPYPSQNRYAECANGVKWVCVTRPGNTRHEFWYSTDGGATWTELTTHRIDSIDVQGGVHIDIQRRADGAERLAVVYVRNQTVRLNLGKFRDASRTSFFWQAASQQVSVAGGGVSSFWRAPCCALVPIGDQWLVPIVWSRNIDGRARLHYQRWLFGEADKGHGQAGGDRVLHDRDSSVHMFPTLDARHVAGFITGSKPDLYVSWATGIGSGEAGGTPTDNLPRQYMARMAASGQNWAFGVQRILRNAGAARIPPGQPTMISAVYTGHAFVQVAAPSEVDQDTLRLHVMDPQDSRRDVVDVPALGAGDIRNVDLCYDPFNGDVYVVANGASNQQLQMIRYAWATRQWGTWAVVAAEAAIENSLSLKRRISGKLIEGIYGIISAGNRQVRHQVMGTVNTLPNAPTWLTLGGARSVNTGLTVGPWAHSDVDGDAQAQYTLERRVNGGAPTYWNGVAFQAGLVNVSGAAASVGLASGWASSGDVLEFRVRTADASGFGDWSPALTYVGTVASNPTWLIPTAGANITTPRIAPSWDVLDQSAYLVELFSVGGAGRIWSSGWVADAGVRQIEVPQDLVDGAGYQLQVTTQNSVGLTSATAVVNFTVSLILPPVVTWGWTAIPAEGAIDVAIANGSPGAGEAAADSNDVYQVDPVSLERTLVARAVAPNAVFRDRHLASGREVEYVIVARTAAGAIRESV